MVSARKAVAIFEQQPPWPDRAESTRSLPEHADLVRRADRLRGPRRRADDRGLRGARGDRPPSPTGWAATCPPTPSRSARSSSEGIKGRAARRARAERLAERARLAARDEELRQPRVGRHGSAASTWPRPRSTDVRRQILVSDTGSQLFAGTLQDAIDPHGRLTRAPGRGGRCASPTPRTCTTRCRAAGRACSTSAVAACPAASASGSCWPARSRPRPRSWCWSSPPRRSTPTPRRGSPRGWPPSGAGGRPWSAPSRRCGCTTPTGSCCSRTAGSIADGTHEDLLRDSPAYRRVVARARWTQPVEEVAPAMSDSAVSDPLATSAETWRDRAADAPAIPPGAGPAAARRVRRDRLSALRRRHLLREQRALETLRRVAQPRARLAGGRQPRGAGVLPRPAARAHGASSSGWSSSTRLAAATALVVPRLLGTWSTTTVAGERGAAEQPRPRSRA